MPIEKKPTTGILAGFRSLTTSKSKKTLCSEPNSRWENMVWPTDVDEYELSEECGKGMSATVWQGTCKTNNEEVAIKQMNLDEMGWGNHWEDIVREAQTMATHHHPNLLPLLCSFVHQDQLWMVEPYISHGSVLNIMKYSHHDGLDEPTIAAIMHETLKGLDYLHRNGMIHRDVKAGNILVDGDGGVYLADFGVSAKLDKRGGSWGQSTRNTFIGTPCWMAPEVMEQSNYDLSADIWSFGITLLELAHGHAPFQKYPPMKVVMMTVQDPPPSLDSEPNCCKRFSRDMHDLVALCLQKDHTKRPSTKELLEHRFFKLHVPKDDKFLYKRIVAPIPDVITRVRNMRTGTAPRDCVQVREEIEQSNEQYVKGLSAWNFDVATLKREADLLPPLEEEPEEVEASAPWPAPGLSLLSGHSSRDLADQQLPSPVMVDLSAVRSTSGSPEPGDMNKRSVPGSEGLYIDGASASSLHGKSIFHGDGERVTGTQSQRTSTSTTYAPQDPAPSQGLVKTPSQLSETAALDESEATIGREVRGAAQLAEHVQHNVVKSHHVPGTPEPTVRNNGGSEPTLPVVTTGAHHGPEPTPAASGGAEPPQRASNGAEHAQPVVATEVNVAQHTKALEAAAAAHASAVRQEKFGRFTKRKAAETSEAGSLPDRNGNGGTAVPDGDPLAVCARGAVAAATGSSDAEAAVDCVVGGAAGGESLVVAPIKDVKRRAGRFQVSKSQAGRSECARSDVGDLGSDFGDQPVRPRSVAHNPAEEVATVAAAAADAVLHGHSDAVLDAPHLAAQALHAGVHSGGTASTTTTAGEATLVALDASPADPSSVATAAMTAAAAVAAALVNHREKDPQKVKPSRFKVVEERGVPFRKSTDEHRSRASSIGDGSQHPHHHQPQQQAAAQQHHHAQAHQHAQQPLQTQGSLPSQQPYMAPGAAAAIDPMTVVNKKLNDLLMASQAQQDAVRMLISAVSECSKGKEDPLQELARSPLMAVHLLGSEVHNNALLEENATLKMELDEYKKKYNKIKLEKQALARERDSLKSQIAKLHKMTGGVAMPTSSAAVANGGTPPGTPAHPQPSVPTNIFEGTSSDLAHAGVSAHSPAQPLPLRRCVTTHTTQPSSPIHRGSAYPGIAGGGPPAAAQKTQHQHQQQQQHHQHAAGSAASSATSTATLPVAVAPAPTAASSSTWGEGQAQATSLLSAYQRSVKLSASSDHVPQSTGPQGPGTGPQGPGDPVHPDV